MRTRVTIYALSMPPSPIFYMDFDHELDIKRYIASWKKIGHCHIRRSPCPLPTLSQA